VDAEKKQGNLCNIDLPGIMSGIKLEMAVKSGMPTCYGIPLFQKMSPFLLLPAGNHGAVVVFKHME